MAATSLLAVPAALAAQASEASESVPAVVGSATPGFTTIDVPSAGTSMRQGTLALYIDPAGDIAGVYLDASGVEHGYVRTANGAIKSFDAPNTGTGQNSNSTVPIGMDTAGDVAGLYSDSNKVYHGFVRSAASGTLTPFSVSGAGTQYDQGTFPESINSAGEIAGIYIDANNLSHGFVRTAAGAVTPFDAIAPTTAGKTNQGTVFAAINTAGVVAGTYVDETGVAHGYVRSATGTITTISAPNAGKNNAQGTVAISIDAAGDAAGMYLDTNNAVHGFVRTASGTFTVIDAPGAGAGTGQGTYPSQFDAAGDIGGIYTDANNGLHGFFRAASGAITTYNAPGASAMNGVINGLAGRMGKLASRAGKTARFFNPVGSSGKKPNSFLNRFRVFFSKLGGVRSQSLGTMPTGGIFNDTAGILAGTIGLGMDTAGDIAGIYTDGDYVAHGFLRAAKGAITTFDAPAAGTGAEQGTGAFSVNASGTVVGSYADQNSVIHGFALTLGQGAVTTKLHSSPASTVYGEPVTFTATVASSSGAAPPDGETVWFMNGATTLGKEALSGGTADFTTTDLPGGTDSVTAVYPGDLNFSGSTSAAVSQTVSKATSYTTLTASPNPSSYAELVTLTAIVSGEFGGTATGTVTFKNGNTTLGTAPLSGGAALFSFTVLPQGTNTVTAVYGGDSDFTGSASSPVSQGVAGEVTNAWIWMDGGSTTGNSSYQPGVYGTLGTPASGNIPGSRESAVSWRDSGGDLWLFGGWGFDTNGSVGPLNDLWELNPSTNQWTWMGGSNSVGSYGGQSGVYGTLGTAASGNIPGGRTDDVSWTDGSGHFWLLGGWGLDANGWGGYLNDLWEFNPATNQWTWMSGSSTIIGSNCVQIYGYTECGRPGVYGVLGTAASGNVPGARQGASTWTDTSGNLWLFGGGGFDATGAVGELNDLWKFTPSSKRWTWMGGSSTVGSNGGQPGVYGTLGMVASGNIPGGRDGASSWTDTSGNFWLFGGWGFDVNGGDYVLNDLWEFSPSTNKWSWRGGNSAIQCNSQGACQPGVYGSSGVSAAGNLPGGRYYASNWTDASGNFWLFGGWGSDANGVGSDLNDFWEFNPSTSQWAWMGGSSTVPTSGFLPGVYGALGVPAAGNIPGSMDSAIAWTDGSGNFWLFGGDYYNNAINEEFYLNTVWKYQPAGSSLPPAATPTFSVGTGNYTAVQTVTISDTTPGATIYYTTDGTGPTTASNVFSKQVTVSATGTLEAMAVAAGHTQSAVALANYVITLPKTTPTITWAKPAAITYGTALSTTQLNATSKTAGTFAYTPPPGTVLDAGSQTLSTTFTPTDTNDYATATATVSLTVNKAAQTVTFTAPVTPVTYGVTPVTLTATASSGLAVTFSVTSGPATVSGSALTITGAGSVVVAANQSGGSDYSAATAVSHTIVVNKATPAVSLKSLPASGVYGASVTLTATLTGIASGAVPGGTVTFLSGTTSLGSGTANSSGIATLTTTALPVGTDSITASYGGDSNYAAAKSSAISATVGKATQTISFTAPASPVTYGATPIKLSATATSGLPVTFAVASGPATVTGSTLTITGVGSVVVTASQAGNGSYSAAPPVQQTVAVTAGTAAIKLTSSAATATYGTSITLTATLTGSGSAKPSGTVTFLNGSAPVGTGTLNSSGVATLALTTLPVGTDSITASFPGDTHYAAITSAALTETVKQAAPTVKLASSTASAAYGASVTLTATLTGAGAKPGGTVNFLNGSTLLGAGTLSSGTATLALTSLASGSYSIKASYLGDTNYAAASSTAVSVTVSKAAQTIKFTAPSSVTYGVAPIALSATGGASGQPVTFTVTSGPATVSASTLTITGAGSVVVTANQAGNSNYAAATAVQQTIKVNKATTTASLTASPTTIAPAASIIFTATLTNVGATPTGSVTFMDGKTQLGTGALSGGVATYTTTKLATGSHSVTASYGGDANYLAATSLAVSVTVSAK
jgi:N-acetylneuraminic acid mutarotase